MSGKALDSYALLAYLRKEPAGKRVLILLQETVSTGSPLHMTEIQYAEVKYMILRKEGLISWNRVEAILRGLPIRYHAVDRTISDWAGEFKARFRLSLADACAAALARVLKIPLVTGDKEFLPLKGEIEVEWIE
jgi:ribonuclease VapC